MKLSKETLLGIRFTGKCSSQFRALWFYNQSPIYIVSSFIDLVKYLFTVLGVPSFLSEKLSQNPLEKFFRCQCQRSTNPSCEEFCTNTQALRVADSLCADLGKGTVEEKNVLVTEIL